MNFGVLLTLMVRMVMRSHVPVSAQAEDHGMDVDVDVHRGEVGEGVLNLPADVWADSGAETDDEPMSDEEPIL
jgi:hypothetical protein